MGFWSTLGKIAKVAAPIAAIPFTGGASAVGLAGSLKSALPGVLSAAGNVLGKQEAGKAEGAATQAGVTQAQDRNAINLYQAQQGAQNTAAQTDLQRKNYSDDARSRNAKQAMIAALLGGGGMESKVSVAGVPQASGTGGFMAALAKNPQALAALKELQAQSASKLANPDAFAGGESVKAPSLTGLPDTGKSSGFLSALSRGLQVAGGVGSALGGSGGGAASAPSMPLGDLMQLPGLQLPLPDEPDIQSATSSRRPYQNVRF